MQDTSLQGEDEVLAWLEEAGITWGQLCRLVVAKALAEADFINQEGFLEQLEYLYGIPGAKAPFFRTGMKRRPPFLRFMPMPATYGYA